MANNALTGVGSGATQGVQLTSKNKNEQIGKDEFLKLLVTQLKNQDPEAPMDSKEFAVQLAQFTQVEKLISIDDKLSAQNTAASLGSMAGYLGQQVVLNSSDVAVKSGQGGQLQIDLARNAGEVRVQFLNSQGAVVGEKQLGALEAGKRVVSLSDVGVPDGSYAVKVTATNAMGGGTFNPSAATAGIVSGFIPGATPTLLVGGREVGLAEIREVALPNQAG
jgi:flagellar basal-body rod modification protein FlgD